MVRCLVPILAVELQGRPGNPTAVGSRVRIVLADGAVRVAEVHAGGGYLSQSSTRLSFGLGATAAAKRVEVRWPSGQTATVVTAPEARRLALRE